MIRAHVRVQASVYDMLLAGGPVSGANDAGGRDGFGHVVYEWRGLVERERGAEIGSRVFGRYVADAVRFDGQRSIERIERDGAGGLFGEI